MPNPRWKWQTQCCCGAPAWVTHRRLDPVTWETVWTADLGEGEPIEPATVEGVDFWGSSALHGVAISDDGGILVAGHINRYAATSPARRIGGKYNAAGEPLWNVTGGQSYLHGYSDPAFDLLAEFSAAARDPSTGVVLWPGSWGLWDLAESDAWAFRQGNPSSTLSRVDKSTGAVLGNQSFPTVNAWNAWSLVRVDAGLFLMAQQNGFPFDARIWRAEIVGGSPSVYWTIPTGVSAPANVNSPLLSNEAIRYSGDLVVARFGPRSLKLLNFASKAVSWSADLPEGMSHSLRYYVQGLSSPDPRLALQGGPQIAVHGGHIFVVGTGSPNLAEFDSGGGLVRSATVHPAALGSIAIDDEKIIVGGVRASL